MDNHALSLLDNPSEVDIVTRMQLVKLMIRWIHKEHWGNLLPKITSLEFIYSREFISDASESLFTGKVGFITYLKKMDRATRKGNQISDYFNHFYLDFFSRCSGQAFQKYRQIIEQHINRYWEKPLSRRNIHFSARTIDSHPWITLQQACRDFDLNKSTIKSAIRQHLVRSETLEKEKRVLTLIYKPDLIAREDRLRSLLSAKEAAVILGCTKAQFSRLREVENFEVIASPEEDGCAQWQFYRDDIYQYRDSFLKNTSYDEQREHWSLPQLLQYFGGQIDDPLISLLQAVKSNELKVSFKDETNPVLSSMMFSKSEFSNWYEKRKLEHNLISIPVAAKLMNIQQEFAYQLVRVGLLETSCASSGSTRWLSKISIDQFQQKYVLLSKLSKKTGKSSRALMSHLASCGIFPVDQEWEKPLRQKVYLKEYLFDVQILTRYL